ncbi:MAG: hypothetical protein MK085_12870, partial [Phycisphaerales bacterium]|nr:hypothetical protein [Phycisphaerales bacterium]
NSDFIPGSLKGIEVTGKSGSELPPFEAVGFKIDGTRTWRSEEGGRLSWENSQIAIRDFNAYNFLRYLPPQGRTRSTELNLGAVIPVSDVRISGALEVDDPTELSTSVELRALNHRFVYAIRAGKASLALLDSAGKTIQEAEVPFEPSSGFELDIRNVDQRMSMRINGDELVRLDYDWSPMDRLANAFVEFDLARYCSQPYGMQRRWTGLTWDFAGSGVALRSLQVDRDLYYKSGRLAPRQQAQANGLVIEGLLFATDPREPAVLGEDQFLMLGDNSDFSRDSRFLGRPHPLVVDTVGDDTPFVVHRDLLVGKAWCVYFPAPGRITPGGPAIVPDFGRLRFIR